MYFCKLRKCLFILNMKKLNIACYCGTGARSMLFMSVLTRLNSFATTKQKKRVDWTAV